MTFKELHIIEPILRALKAEGYAEPTPIQEQAVPSVLTGRDLLACAQTGTGKTAAFAVPVLQRLNAENQQRPAQPDGGKARKIRALILTPTRELALQIFDSFRAYGRFLRLRCCVVFGGVNQNNQVQALKRGVDILVATPGRLNDLIGQGFIQLDQVEIFVLDEADRMLDMGFINDVKKVIAQIPQEKQTLLFSATIPPEIQEIADRVLRTDKAVIEVTPSATTVEAISQQVCYVDRPNKPKLLVHLLKNMDIPSALVFTRTKHGADRVARQLQKADIPAHAIHGDKSQGARQAALEAFKKGNVRVLVATDIAARGIDIEDLTHVFNFDIPEVPETYVHRIGRTGRAGQAGTAISFCEINEAADLKAIEKTIGKTIPVLTDHPYPMQETQAVPKAELQRQRRERAAAYAEQAREAKQKRAGKSKQKAESAATKAAAGAEKPAAAQQPKRQASPAAPGAQTPKAQQEKNRQLQAEKKDGDPSANPRRQGKQQAPAQDRPGAQAQKSRKGQPTAARKESRPGQPGSGERAAQSRRRAPRPKPYEYRDNSRMKDDIVTYAQDWGSASLGSLRQDGRKKPEDQPLSGNFIGKINK